MIKKIKKELVVLVFLMLGIFAVPNIDGIVYNEFSYFHNLSSNVYLKNFFIKITVLGDSLWFFLASILIFIFSFFFKKIFFNGQQKTYNKIKYFCFFLFTTTFVTGVLTQILKHIVGRPRPNYAIEKNFSEFNFFNFDSSFHSFPSGHTSTIFVVAFAISLLTPRIKYAYIFFASIIAFSRVMVGAHYLTDVLAGIALALIGFKVSSFIFNRFKIKKELYIIKKNDLDIFGLSLILFVILIVFVSVGSSIDLFISSLFQNNEDTFLLQSFHLVSILSRKIFLPFLIIYMLVLPVLSLYLPIKKIYFNFNFNFKNITFLYFIQIFNLVVVVNVLFKNLWGRARPNDVLELGGWEQFTPWYQISENCSTNCSFVSGDASVGFSLIALYFITEKKIYIWLSLISGGFLGVIRISEGGHFLSDIIIAGFLIFLLTFFQFKIYQKRY